MTRNQIIGLLSPLAVIIVAVVSIWFGEKEKESWRLKGIVTGLILLMVAGISIYVITLNPAPQGKIISPLDGESVSRDFTVEGTLKNIPAEKHAWTVVQINNRLYPKEPEIPLVDQHWLQDVSEGGNPPSGKFSVILIVVGPQGNKEIKTWLNKVHVRESAPALNKISGSSKLDAATNLTLSPR